MYLIRSILILAGIFLGGASNVLVSQTGDEIKLKMQAAVYLQKKAEDPEYGADPYVKMPNLNLIPLYKEEKLLNQIEATRNEGNLERLDSLLTPYISKFGIKNFKDDVGLLWLLGKTREQLGDTSGALLYFELGLNHQRENSGMIKNRYDSLSARFRSDWVDLPFYYRLLEARRKIDPLIPPQGVMLNMGKKVNSDRADYAPFMHPSDSVLIFTSRRDEDIQIDDFQNSRNEDLFYIEKDFMTGNWTYSQKFSKTINSEFNEGSACLNSEGRILYFARCDDPAGFGSCDLYSAEYVGGDWVNVQNLGSNVNSEFWESQPNISPDGKMLYFTSNREGGFGGSDIFVCYKLPEGSFGPAQNLGPVINTYENEVTPFFHAINKTLYFSSTGHLQNIGGYDIFKSRWLADHWESPNNLGPLINSPSHEYYFSIDGKGIRLFYAKAKPGDSRPEIQQDFDLYSFPLPMEARPDAIEILKGYLIDSVTGNPLTGVILILDKTEGIEIAPKFINPYGYFEFDLVKDHYYEIYVQGENYFTVKSDIDLTADTSFKILTQTLFTGKPIVFQNFNFEENSYDLNEKIEPKLDYLALFLKRYPMFKVQISGHTDSEGEAKYNLQLSRKRAGKIQKYMITAAGVPENQVLYKGFGETRPVVPNTSPENKLLNRRVEFELILDPNYSGDAFLPTEEELELNPEEEILDPEFEMDKIENFDWDSEEGLEEEIPEDEDPELLKEYDDWGVDENAEDESTGDDMILPPDKEDN